MKLRFALAAGLFAMMSLPLGANAQGLVEGAREGARRGNSDAGPIGGIVGGAIGAGVGTVNGALGIRPRYARGCRTYYRHGHRYCRYY